MERIINGDIYIRRIPGFIPLPDNEKIEVEEERDYLLSEAEKKYDEDCISIEENENISKIEKGVLLEILDNNYEKLKHEIISRGEIMTEKGMPDVKGFRTFWILDCLGETIKLVEQTDDIPRREEKFSSIPEMNKEFMSLREALAVGEYYGNDYYFKQAEDSMQKEPIKVNGKQSDLYATVTYVFGNRALVDNRVTDKYEVIISDEFLANISSYGSDIHEEYRDRSELYQAVFKQLTKNKGLNM